MPACGRSAAVGQSQRALAAKPSRGKATAVVCLGVLLTQSLFSRFSFFSSLFLLRRPNDPAGCTQKCSRLSDACCKDTMALGRAYRRGPSRSRPLVHLRSPLPLRYHHTIPLLAGCVNRPRPKVLIDAQKFGLLTSIVWTSLDGPVFAAIRSSDPKHTLRPPTGRYTRMHFAHQGPTPHTKCHSRTHPAHFTVLGKRRDKSQLNCTKRLELSIG